MIFLKNNFLLIIILLLTIILRINVDTFIPGYNYDEIAIMSIAKLNFPFEILKESALLDYHAPLYYLISHFFTYFSNEWLYLRLFNVFLSVLNIYIFYKIGKELKNKKLGLILALFLAVNHFQISLVNFIKFYTLCILLISISIYYLIRILNKKNDYIKLGLISGLYSLSATLGVIFAFIQYTLLLFVNKENYKSVIKSALIALTSFILYLPILSVQTYIALNNIISPHGDYQKVDLYTIYEFFNDYFSPLTNYSANTITIDLGSFISDILTALKNGNIDIFSILVVTFMSIIPVVLAIFFIFKTKNYILKNLLYCALANLVVFTILTNLGFVGFTPSYVYQSGMLFIIVFISSIFEMNNNKIKNTILIYLILIQLVIPNCYPIEKRSAKFGKNKIYYCLEKYFNDNSDNRIYIATNGGRFIQKYYKNKNIFSFDYEHTGFSNDRKIVELAYGKKELRSITRNNIKEKLQKLIKNECSEDFNNYIISSLINPLNNGDKITYMFNSDISTFLMKDSEINNYLKKSYLKNAGGIKGVTGDEFPLTQTILADISTTYCNECLLKILDKNLKRTKIEQYIDSKQGIYTKTFETEYFDKSSEWIAKNALNGWIFITYTKQ